MFTPEWLHRIDAWRNELTRHFYRPLGTVPLRGFVTSEQLDPDLAARGDFAPMPPGTAWGGKWEYAWFKGEVVLPPEVAGERIVLRPDVGAEAMVLVNGRHAGAVDSQHAEITLSRSGAPGARYEILLEAYAGHGPTPCEGGPAPPERVTVPDPGPAQRMVGESTYGVWQEDVYQLWLDVETLYQLRMNIDQESLRAAEIDRGLRDFTLIADLELPREEMLAACRRCRERLAPLLACVNGSTAPLFFCFGHAHIDVAWLWPLAETMRKCARTFGTQLALMEEYPEYRFLQSQPLLYRMVKERYPGLYTRIKEAAASGRFIPEGGMWVEADTNVTGGESLIRQLLLGKRFFREEFGVDCELLWLPDVFGYTGALPQIMRGCGIRYFSTQKIFWNYNGGEPFPYNTFLWEGIDGSTILTHLHNDYNAMTDPASVIGRWRERVQKDGISTRLYPFGHGDGGGGATRNHLEFLRRLGDLEGAPRTRMAGPAEFFRDLEARGAPGERYVGELYFQAHRGTYTTQARTKRGNRKCEFALREAEIWGAAAGALRGFAYPAAAMDEAWRELLLHQFHDILPGSSIHRVYEEAEAAQARVLAFAEMTAGAARASLAAPGEAAAVFNSLSWARRALVRLPAGWDGAADGAGNPLPVQETGDGKYAEAAVPACGWATLWPAALAAAPAHALRAAPDCLENELIRVEIDARGGIRSILDKETGREISAGVCNEFRMFRDIPAWFDAWDIDSQYELCPVDLPEEAEVEAVAAGPLWAAVRVARRLHDSRMTQEIVLRRGSRRIDFWTTIDWRERHKLLKVAFPVDVHAHEAVHEIQFGHIRRPNHRSRPFDADRFEVCNHKWTALCEEGRGAAVLNDCKYGVSVLGRTISLTLLRSPLAPDMDADRGRQEFAYAFYFWGGSLMESGVPREAYDLNCPVTVTPGAAGEASLFALSAPNVVIETVKPADDGSGDIVVRLYEAMRTATNCRLRTSLPAGGAAEADMLERPIRSLPGGEEIALDFRPFEIKTIRLRLK
ncbi:MAG: alpha-mannosidase [Patescibacteria group bacterium]